MFFRKPLKRPLRDPSSLLFPCHRCFFWKICSMFGISEPRANFLTVRIFIFNQMEREAFVDTTRHYGLIIKHLRKHSGLSVRKLAEKIGRSIGWISEIENECGTARLTDAEFQRIVDALDGGKHREMFRTWVANHQNSQRSDRTFDGAVLKFIRLKKQMRLRDAAGVSGLSVSRLSKIEGGISPVTPELRNKIMVSFGYSPSSFKNLSTDPVRSKVVPLRYKLEILMRKMSELEIETVFNFALTVTANNQLNKI